jgi:polyisoprenoid-binding protein YceI
VTAGHLRRWAAGGGAAAVALVVGGPFVYTHFIESKAPARLRLSSNGSSSTVAAAPVPVDGTWTVGAGSQAGYRVKEVLFGQSHEAVGRTTNVTGSFRISGTTVTASTFTVDLTTVTSDQDRRDRQFQGRIMDTALYPTATFAAGGPVDLGSVPAAGIVHTVSVPGQLTLHGTTRPVTVPLTVRYTGSTVDVSGSIPVTFADWNIPNPSFAGVVTTEDHGVVEFLLHFNHS